MFDHVLVISQFVALFVRLVAFFGSILLLWILLSFPVGDEPTPSLSDKNCHDVARLWGWKLVDQDNQDMKAKAVTRWTCASCGESKDVRFDNMKKFGPGKHKCSKQSQPQGKEANATAKDGRPCVTSHGVHRFRLQCFMGTQLTKCTSGVCFCLRTCIIHVLAGVGMTCPMRTKSWRCGCAESMGSLSPILARTSDYLFP